MRVLTPVAPDERLVSSGCFLYDRNGASTDVTEPWTVHERLGGRITRVERDARAMFGVTLLAEVVESAAGDDRVERFEIRLEMRGAGAPREVHARYQFAASTVAVDRRIDGADAPTEVVDLPAGVVVMPLMRLFFGPAIRKVVERGRGAPVPVLTPYLDDPTKTSRVLGPTIDRWSASLLWEETLAVDERPRRVGCYTFMNRHHGEHSRFWITDDGRLIRYRYHQRDGSVWVIRSTAEG